VSDPSSPSVVGTVRAKLALRTRARTARESVTAARYARWRTTPVVRRTVMYESFSGNGMLDNPEAIFRHLLTQPDMADLEHIWVLDDPEKHPEVLAEFAGNPKVRFVKILSDAYFKALATSEYLINNATFPQELAKRSEQTYLNTWHGIPLKYMGFDMPGGGPSSRNITRNFLNADFMIGACEFMTDTMYRRAYRMQGIYRGAVIEEGHPRTDRQVEAVKDPEPVLRLLEERGVRVDGRKVVLFAPTWRGDSFQDPRVNAGQLLATVKDLQKSLDPAEHVVLLKVHQVVYDAVRQRVGECDFLVPNSVPTNQTLAVADLLVTDYSSIFFDYLATGRPVVHYVPDLDDYRAGRGLYLAESDLPGPVCATMPELVEAVAGALAAGPSDRSAELAAVYNPKDDGSVCARVVDIVFRRNEDPSYVVRRDFGTDKETLLIYLGSLKTQGITTSALNLLRNLDYDRYDVTAFYTYSKGRDRLKNAALVDERARVIPRAVQFNGSPRRVRKETQKLMEHGLPEQLSTEHVRFWTDEWQRVFGHAKFDHLIDFSGYGCYSPFLFSVTEAKHKSIWLHNDMYADMQRETVGEKHLEDRLQAVFTTYKYFDHLVSVSPELDQVNRKSLAEFAPPDRFTYAVNTIDGERILELAGLTASQAVAKADGAEVAQATSGQRVEIDTENLTSAINVLLEHYAVEDVLREARGRLRLGSATPEKGTTTFVNVGRLSPAKNHARLIKAFAKVHERNPHVRLIIMGYGPLEPELQGLVNSLGMESAVTLAGLVDNPFAILAESDCFVLSSDYEGQPMVILEARVLGLPVVTTAFSSVGDSVPPDAGIVVPQTVKGVAEGMQRFLDGKVQASALDTVAYNARAMEQFDAAIHHRPGA